VHLKECLGSRLGLTAILVVAEAEAEAEAEAVVCAKGGGHHSFGQGPVAMDIFLDCTFFCTMILVVDRFQNQIDRL
jgi:hypothetical protein